MCLALHLWSTGQCVSCWDANFGASHGHNAFFQTMEREFRMWIKWYGKKCSGFKIEQGDFLDNNMKEKINSAS